MSRENTAGLAAEPLAALISAADHGDAAATDALFKQLYPELRRRAEGHLRSLRGPGLTLTPTTVLHELYLDMGDRKGTSFPDRSRFLAYAARAMRSLIIDYVRERRAHKRGGQYRLTALNTEIVDATPDAADELTRLGSAVDELAHADAALAELVDLKFFCGLSFIEIAELRGVSERTVARDWSKARALLRSALTAG